MTDSIKQDLEKTTLQVVGLSCESCVKHTEQALGSTNGIKKATVNLNSNSADIVYDPGAVDLEAAQKAVQDAGYELILPEKN